VTVPMARPTRKPAAVPVLKPLQRLALSAGVETLLPPAADATIGASLSASVNSMKLRFAVAEIGLRVLPFPLSGGSIRSPSSSSISRSMR
jgi:hypothetical protein